MRTVLGGLLAFASGVAFASNAKAPDPYPALAKLARVLGYVERSYVDPVELDDLVGAALRGVVGQLDGPSDFLPAADYAALRTEASLGFGGVGIGLEMVQGHPMVMEVAPESPAMRAGMRAGEVLEAVDGQALAGLPIERVAEQIAGTPGTRVRLEVAGEDGRRRELELVRAPRLRRTAVARRLPGAVYLRVARFDRRTARDLQSAAREVFGDAPVRALVLDLRGNPGGLVDQAVEVAELWLDGGPVVRTAGRARAAETASARGGRWMPTAPTAVLIDGATASAAEIVAGALSDRGAARTFGTRSFGKGSVQNVIELEDGSALKLTVARYLTPSGRSIDGVGLEPDEPVAPNDNLRLGDPRHDRVLAAALRWLEDQR